MILSSQGGPAPMRQQALEHLCHTYWYPVYAYIRRHGHDEDAAKDLTQEFFVHFLERRFLDRADPSKGRFRSFLLKSAQRFLQDEWDKSRAQKRGGGKAVLSLDQEDAAERYRLEAVDDLSPDKLFDRRWARVVLEQAAHRLREEQKSTGHIELYERVRRFLSGEGGISTYAEAAARMNMSEGTLKSWVHRLRRRRRQLVREVIAETVADSELIDLELRELFTALE